MESAVGGVTVTVNVNNNNHEGNPKKHFAWGEHHVR